MIKVRPAIRMIVLLLALAVGATSLSAQQALPDPSQFQLETVVSGLNRPLLLTHAGDGSGRLFVVEQTGAIKVIENGTLLETPFLDVGNLLSRDVFGRGFTERGLLGLAFHPDYATNGLFYINYTDVNGNTVIAQYSVSDDPNVADPASAITVLTQAQPYANHNGGHLAFGPDGYLYIAFGDGGSAGDPNGNGQKPSTLLGTIARIDVHEDGTYTIPPDNPFNRDDRYAPEVWAYGLRNPWRFSFDAETDDLYIADVGQANWEEVNFEPADSPGGLNYGWNIYEGSSRFASGTANGDVVMPVAEYNHAEGISITGGYVYRGESLPALDGVYLYGDFGYGTIWMLARDEAGEWQTGVFMNSSRSVSSFGVDEQNELYVVDYAGSVLKVVPAS